MKRSFSTAAVALAAVVSIGATAPAASAAGKTTTKPAVTKTVKPVKVDKRLLVAKRAVSALSTHKDAALVAAGQYAADSGIAQAPEVQANVEGDRVYLAGLATKAAAATTLAAVRVVDAQVRQVRPENYAVVVNGLRQAAHFQGFAVTTPAEIADLAAQADVKEGEGYDVTAVRQLLAEATSANDQVAPLAASAVEKGVALNALTPQAQQVAFSVDIASAGGLLDTITADLQAVVDALAAMVPVVEPVTEAPVV